MTILQSFTSARAKLSNERSPTLRLAPSLSITLSNVYPSALFAASLVLHSDNWSLLEAESMMQAPRSASQSLTSSYLLNGSRLDRIVPVGADQSESLLNVLTRSYHWREEANNVWSIKVNSVQPRTHVLRNNGYLSAKVLKANGRYIDAERDQQLSESKAYQFTRQEKWTRQTIRQFCIVQVSMTIFQNPSCVLVSDLASLS